MYATLFALLQYNNKAIMCSTTAWKNPVHLKAWQVLSQNCQCRYSRSCPVFKKNCVAPDSNGTNLAPVHVNIGNAGASFSQCDPVPLCLLTRLTSVAMELLVSLATLLQI